MPYYNKNQQPIRLGDKIAKGGEATISEVAGSPKQAAKIYHKPPSAEKIEKLQHLSKLRGNSKLDFMVLPTELVFDQTQKCVGYLMPQITDANILYQYVNAKERMRNFPTLSHHDLYTVAQNIASKFSILHGHYPIVFGDINESNLLVRKDLSVYLIDSDTVQYTNGKVYMCHVGKPEYVPKEGKSASQPLTPHYDLFGLAVLFFGLLMGGRYPYKGQMQINRIEKSKMALYLKDKGIYPYIEKRVARPFDTDAQLYNLLEPEIRRAFAQTFHLGANDPTKRVTAIRWKSIFQHCLQKQQTCSKHPLLQYGYHLPNCPWCGPAS